MNVSLPAELKRWLDQQVKTGGYGTASEYLRDLLRKTRARQQQRTLDASLAAAVAAGANVTMDDSDWASIRKAARAGAAARRRRP